MTPQLDSSELLTNSQCSLSELCGVCTSLAPLLSRSSLLILTINNVNSHKQMSALTFHNTPFPALPESFSLHPLSIFPSLPLTISAMRLRAVELLAPCLY